MAFRSNFSETDEASFVSNTIDETGAMVIKSSKGGLTPIKCSSEKDIISNFGNPSSTYPEVFEAIAFCRKAPCWIVSAVGSGSLYGGIDIAASGVIPFVAGRDYDTYVHTNPAISHSFFSASPSADDLAMSLKYTVGTLNSYFTATLYKVKTTGNELITSYMYSLSRIKDGYGKSIYYADVFDKDTYVKIMVNANYIGTAYTQPGTTVYAFDGGHRGYDPVTGNYTTAWNNFQKQNVYRAKIFMDCNGNSATTINSIVTNYQKWAHAISMVPMGNDAAEAISYRQGLGISSDKISLYTNWMRIQDDYNNSFAWISQIGSVGKKYAYMFDVFDAAAPAGVDENSHGGLISDWRVVEVENDYTDYDPGLGSELQLLDEAQINPIIMDEVDGVKIYGDKTLLSYNTDTSFTGTRRMYNYIEDVIVKQILRKQEFKINDPIHRLKAKTMTTTFLEPILNGGWIREMAVICDSSNNTNSVLEQRQFILDVYIKVTPTSEFCHLNLVRVSQNLVISQMIQGTTNA